MDSSILITDCLQYDFIGSIDRFAGLPNALHIGHDESLRLLGNNPAEGPLARMIAWAHSQTDLKVIHVRDWHDPEDPAQRTHLEQFGLHCVLDTPGAQFVFPMDARHPDLHVVNSIGLSNFVTPDLDILLRGNKSRPTRVGLMGVWTEAKITFLAYELRSRYPDFKIAVCSALTASSSRENHFLALDQLERVLGVEVISSVGEFIDFLGGRFDDAPLIGFSHKHPEVVAPAGVSLSDADHNLVRYLFRGCRQVDLRVLDGGFSGNMVVSTHSIDMYGHEQVPHVVKIGPQKLIGRERTAFERIEAVLGNSAPHVADFADLGDRGAIKYRYAAMGGGHSRSFQSLYESGLDEVQVNHIFNAIFNKQLGRFYRASKAEYRDLFKYYEFKPQWAESVASKVAALLNHSDINPEYQDKNTDFIVFPGGIELPHIARFYDRVLPQLPIIPRSHYFSYVHGDLNGSNIIIDPHNNVWLIDFFHTHRGHVLKDLIKLENDVLFIFTKIHSEADLIQAQKLSEQLMAVQDLAVPLPPLDPDIHLPELQRAYRTLQTLRGFYPDLIHADRDPMQWLIAHVRYAVHTLSFEESNPWQKRWALFSACKAAEALHHRLVRSGPLRIDWLPDSVTLNGKLGITFLPGRRDYGRSLNDDIATIEREAVDAVVCLISHDEFARYGVESLLVSYREHQLDVKHLPIVDGRVPSIEQMNELIAWLTERLSAGKKVLVHCVGGLGRAGTVCACFLRAQGADGESAIATVRAARSLRAIETEVQERFIKNSEFK
jgi:protein-tyrosine phosphatase/nicotinamidase-related amidase